MSVSKAHELLGEGDRGALGAARLLREETGFRRSGSLPKSASRRASSLLKEETSRSEGGEPALGGVRIRKMGKRDKARLSRKLKSATETAAAFMPADGEAASSSGDEAAARAAKGSAAALDTARARRAARKLAAPSNAQGAFGAGRKGEPASAQAAGRAGASGQAEASGQAKALRRAGASAGVGASGKAGAFGKAGASANGGAGALGNAGSSQAVSRKASERLARERKHAFVRASLRRDHAAKHALDAVQSKLSASRATAATRSGAAVAAGAGAAPSLGFPLVVLVVFLAVAIAVGAVVGEASKPKDGPLAGFPPYITASMVRAALQCQEDYGHPAGCTIAQIIAESGQGDTMSLLATRDHNLFGMKWSIAYEGEPEVAGHASWSTGEEYEPGQTTQVTAQFIVFTGDEACITFRSRVFLQGSRYAKNALIRQAIAEHSSDKMAEGLKDAGWATDSAYVDRLKAIMDEWGLRALDSMTVEQWDQQMASGGKGQDYDSATDAQKRVADQAWREPQGRPGWCAAWVCDVFDHAGITAARMSYASDYMCYCHDALDASSVKVGMIVVTPSTSSSPGIGHIGIYVGGGLIRSMELTGVVSRPIDNWLGTYTVAPSYMGWMNGTDLSAS